MSRRVLPSRATRGTKPPKTIEEENKDNQIYAKMFGNDLDDQEDYQQKKAQENVRRERTVQNLKKYSYARGYTYCYDLDTFPRLEDHPSYAIDWSNIFASTYSQQNKLYNSTPLRSLINRVYFGLPYTENDQRRGQSKTKNICHYYLFENEDKKYNLDRMIFSYKKIYKNLELILSQGKISQFSILKKDPQLEQIIKSDRQLPQKKLSLLKKIKILQQRKSNNINYWYYDDQLFFSHSLNQKLHSQVQKEKKNVEASKMHALLFTNQFYLKTVIEQENKSLPEFLKTVFTYYNSLRMAISQNLLTDIFTKYSTKILSLVNDQPKVSFPCQLFYFGSHHLIEVLNCILSNKIQNMNEANYYTAKFAWRKLFKCELLPNRLQKLKLEEYTALSKKLVEECRYFYKKNVPQAPQEEIKLDGLINWQQLNQDNESSVSIFKQGEGVQISGKQLIIICIYNCISQAFVELLPFADKYGEEFTHFITCELFGKYSHGLVQATNKPIVGTLKSNIELLCEVLGSESLLGTFNFVVNFQYDQERNIGILWKKKKLQEDGWQTQKEQQQQNDEEEQELEQGQGSPKKKIKQNEL